MITKELEKILEGGRETREIDFKAPCKWDVRTFVKDILAMANLRDGGWIIVGIKEKEDKTFERCGVSEEEKLTYDIDIMKDQIGNYADPFVDFEVNFITDRENKTYVVIRVFPFEEIPVICKKDDNEVKAGVIYYRNRNKKVESAPISNSTDMKELIETAILKRMKKIEEIHQKIFNQNFTFSSKQELNILYQDKQKFYEEISNIKDEKLIVKITSRGYWLINFCPIVYRNKFSLVKNCKEIVERNIVTLRGWFYPHFPYDNIGFEGFNYGENYYQGWIDNGTRKELWRLYLSGQFLHYLALPEDWAEEDDWYIYAKMQIPQPGSIILLLGSIVYQISEVFVFLLRLVENDVYNEGVEVKVTLNNTKGRKLKIDDLRRIPFSKDYKTSAESITAFDKICSKDEILLNYKKFILDTIFSVVDKFGWENPSQEIIMEDIEKFLSGKI